jgi:hypothetical protein
LAGANCISVPGRRHISINSAFFVTKSDQAAKVLFWVSPSQRLYDLFWAIHNMKEQKPEDVVALAAEHNVHFLPPPPGA